MRKIRAFTAGLLVVALMASTNVAAYAHDTLAANDQYSPINNAVPVTQVSETQESETKNLKTESPKTKNPETKSPETENSINSNPTPTDPAITDPATSANTQNPTSNKQSAPVTDEWHAVDASNWKHLLAAPLAVVNADRTYALSCEVAENGDVTAHAITNLSDAPLWQFEEHDSALYMRCESTAKYVAYEQGTFSFVDNRDKATQFNAWKRDGFAFVTLRHNNATWWFNESSQSFSLRDDWNSWNATTRTLYFSSVPVPSDKPSTVFDTPIVTESPSNTVINLFDYWDFGRTTETPGWIDGNTPYNEYQSSINKGHALKFVRKSCAANDGERYGAINNYTGDNVNHCDGQTGGLRTGIVAPVLGEDGFPYLNGAAKPELFEGWSIGEYEQPSTVESLAYLFDPAVTTHENEWDGRKTYTDVRGLLSRAADGTLSYDSAKHFAQFTETDNGQSGTFTVYDKPASCTDQFTGQFFPFNDAAMVDSLSSCMAGNLNHYFGLNMNTRFIQANGGYTDTSRAHAANFTFSGDDDVWLFIDGVLVGDLGGIHQPAGVSVDFSSGRVTTTYLHDGQQKTAESNLVDYFKQANRYDASAWTTVTVGGQSREIFADNTTHVLKFFYLERGGDVSNMRVACSLVDIPETSVRKIDQYGNPVAGAGFATYRGYVDANNTVRYQSVDGTDIAWPTNAVVDKDGTVRVDGKTVIAPTFRGTTDKQGVMPFANGQGASYSLEHLKSMLLMAGSSNGTYSHDEQFILREIDVPDGYRTVSDETVLYFDGSVIQSLDMYSSGTAVSPTVLVTANSVLYKQGVESLDDARVQYYSWNPSTDSYETNGTLFSVLHKRNTSNGSNTWSPLTGNDRDGYSQATNSTMDSIIDAAQSQQEQYGNAVFSVAPNGMQLLVDTLPGSIHKYYSYVETHQFGSDSMIPARLYAACAEYFYGSGAISAQCSAVMAEHSVDESRLKALADVEYYVASYWTTGSLDEATESNTWPVYSHANTGLGTQQPYNGFGLSWGSRIRVPNMENRLYFQNFIYDEASSHSDGQDVNRAWNGAAFGLYAAGEAANGSLYYRVDTDGTNIPRGAVGVLLEPGLQSGEACFITAAGDRVGDAGSFSVDVVTGVMTVQIGENTSAARISPVTNASGETCFKRAEHAATLGEDGANYFSRLRVGQYALRQVTAPSDVPVTEDSAGNPHYDADSDTVVDYNGNTAQTRVVVTDTAIYANAGGDHNGVTVGNSVGFLAGPLETSVSSHVIDETLSWIAMFLRVNGSTTFSGLGSFLNGMGDTWNEDAQFAVASQSGIAPHNAAAAPSSLESDLTIAREKTGRFNDAMVTYLQYAPNQFVKYVTNTNTAQVPGVEDGQESRGNAVFLTNNQPDFSWNGNASGNGEGDLRLYADEGWSSLSIYQDYSYGKLAVSKVVGYDQLAGRDLTGLYSNPTFIAYYNQIDGDDEDMAFVLPATGGQSMAWWLWVVAGLMLAGAAVLRVMLGRGTRWSVCGRHIS